LVETSLRRVGLLTCCPAAKITLREIPEEYATAEG
jgi:hypothetical protein